MSIYRWRAQPHEGVAGHRLFNLQFHDGGQFPGRLALRDPLKTLASARG
ncbi:MAG: hypothetical protein FWD51_01665 [Betaproteobacteria bacterium]|nr:hypothetical protein [Betaproteobacteria bacterium]